MFPEAAGAAAPRFHAAPQVERDRLVRRSSLREPPAPFPDPHIARKAARRNKPCGRRTTYDCEYKQRRRCERKRRFPRETYEPPKAAPQTPPGPDPPHRWRPAGDAAPAAVSWRRNGTPIRRKRPPLPPPPAGRAAHRSVRPGRSCHQGMSRGTTSTPKCIPRPFMPSIRILVLVYPIYHEKSTVFFKMLFNV